MPIQRHHFIYDTPTWSAHAHRPPPTLPHPPQGCWASCCRSRCWFLRFASLRLGLFSSCSSCPRFNFYHDNYAFALDFLLFFVFFLFFFCFLCSLTALNSFKCLTKWNTGAFLGVSVSVSVRFGRVLKRIVNSCSLNECRRVPGLT